MPAFDRWFDNVYTKAWGRANDTEVIVDHINQADLPAASPPRRPPAADTMRSRRSRRCRSTETA